MQYTKGLRKHSFIQGGFRWGRQEEEDKHNRSKKAKKGERTFPLLREKAFMFQKVESRQKKKGGAGGNRPDLGRGRDGRGNPIRKSSFLSSSRGKIRLKYRKKKGKSISFTSRLEKERSELFLVEGELLYLSLRPVDPAVERTGSPHLKG